MKKALLIATAVLALIILYSALHAIIKFSIAAFLILILVVAGHFLWRAFTGGVK